MLLSAIIIAVGAFVAGLATGICIGEAKKTRNREKRS